MKRVFVRLTAGLLIAGLMAPSAVWAAEEPAAVWEMVQDESEDAVMDETVGEVTEDVPEESTEEKETDETTDEETEKSDEETEQDGTPGETTEETEQEETSEEAADVSKQEEILKEVEAEEEERQAMAAGWNKQNGRYWYSNADGSYTKNDFQKINGKWYFFDEEGWLVTGWKKVDGKYYYFKKTGAAGMIGRMFTGWQNIGGKTYYFGTDGAARTGWQKIGNYKYYFKASGSAGTIGKLWTGWLLNGGKIYYLKKTGDKGVKGRMFTGWKTINQQVFYFGTDGKMAIGWTAVGKRTFYFKASGDYGVKGKMFTGFQTISKKQYYFKKTGDYGLKGARFENCTYTVGGKLYAFDSSGVAMEVTADYVYATDPTNGKTYKVETQYYTDPQIGTGANQVTEKEFLAAVLYTEAGDQGVEGQTMVGTVIYNRMMSGSFPNSLAFIIYADQQFEVARNGMLTNLLKKIRDNDKDTLAVLNRYGSFKAAEAATSIYKNYKSGKTKARVIPDVKATNYGGDFSYLYFMTPAAFKRLGLSESGCDTYTYTPDPQKTKGHIFFRNWVYA